MVPQFGSWAAAGLLLLTLQQAAGASLAWADGDVMLSARDLAFEPQVYPARLRARSPAGTGSGGADHHWQGSAYNYQQGPHGGGTAATSDAERVANQHLASPSNPTTGGNPNAADANLRSGVHPTPSAPGQQVVTVGEAHPGAATSDMHHVPTTQDSAGRPQYDPSQTDHTYTNPNQGRNAVPQPPNKQGPSFRRRDLEGAVFAALQRRAAARQASNMHSHTSPPAVGRRWVPELEGY